VALNAEIGQWWQLATSTWPEKINDKVTRITIDCDECST